MIQVIPDQKEKHQFRIVKQKTETKKIRRSIYFKKIIGRFMRKKFAESSKMVKVV
jgi:hypothetical protein